MNPKYLQFHSCTGTTFSRQLLHYRERHKANSPIFKFNTPLIPQPHHLMLRSAPSSPSQIFPLADINFKAHHAPPFFPTPLISSLYPLSQKTEDINTFQPVEG